VPEFETTAFVPDKPLSEATVAIVTTASLHIPIRTTSPPMDDTSYRASTAAGPRSTCSATGARTSTHRVRSYDMNTVFPIDRLEELAAEGVIGRGRRPHIAFAGNQFDPCRRSRWTPARRAPPAEGAGCRRRPAHPV
jgi:D-proline reductase (dithiol) PrdB